LSQPQLPSPRSPGRGFLTAGEQLIKKLLLLTAVVVLGSLAAQAGTVTLTFEGLQNNEQVLNYYNGG